MYTNKERCIKLEFLRISERYQPTTNRTEPLKLMQSIHTVVHLCSKCFGENTNTAFECMCLCVGWYCFAGCTFQLRICFNWTSDAERKFNISKGMKWMQSECESNQHNLLSRIHCVWLGKCHGLVCCFVILPCHWCWWTSVSAVCCAGIYVYGTILNCVMCTYIVEEQSNRVCAKQASYGLILCGLSISRKCKLLVFGSNS